MRTSTFAFALALATPCVFSLTIAACTSSDNPSPANGVSDASTAKDATNPNGADGSHPGNDATASDDSSTGDDGGDLDAALSCANWDAALEYDASELDGGSSVNADGGGALPGPTSPFGCSLIGDAHAPIHVVNNAPCPIDLWWVDYNCQEEYFGSADPNGGTFDNDTWETHPWRIRLQGSEALLREIPPVPEGTIDGGTNLTYP